MIKKGLQKSLNTKIGQEIENLKRIQKEKELEKMKEKLKKEQEQANDNLTPEEKNEVARKEKIMARFRRQILNPNYSDNIYMELNITNLRKFYEKSLKEFNDIQEFFSINPANEQEVLYFNPETIFGLKK